MMNWLPPQGPLPATLPASLQPLAEFKDHLIVIGNLGNAAFPGCARWGHGAYGGIFTGGTVDPNSGNGKEYWEPLQPSIDQQIATQFAKESPDAPAQVAAVRDRHRRHRALPGLEPLLLDRQQAAGHAGVGPLQGLQPDLHRHADDQPGHAGGRSGRGQAAPGAQEPAGLRGRRPGAVQAAPGRRGPDVHRRAPDVDPRPGAPADQRAGGGRQLRQPDVERQRRPCRWPSPPPTRRCCGRCRCS